MSTGRTALVLHTATMSGPARTYAARLALTTEQHERFVYAPAAGPAADLFEPSATVRIEHFATLAVPGTVAGVLRLALRFAVDVVTFIRLFRADGIETVITSSTYTPSALIAGKLLRRRVVVACGELLLQRNDTRAAKRLFARSLIALVGRTADLIICCSDAVRRQFPQRAATVTVYPRLEVKRSRERTAQPGDGPLIAVVGSVAPSRGQDVAIEAMPSVLASEPAAALEFAGLPLNAADREYAAALEARVEQLGLERSVRFLGHVEQAEDLMARARVVVNPCRFDEPFGRVAYEALAAGTPIVLSDTGANSEILEHEFNALIVPPEDPAALAAAIVRVLESEELARTLVANAAGALDRVDASATDRKYLDAIESMVRGRARE